MVYYKFINTETRRENETNPCNNGKCPEFRIIIVKGNLKDGDCRKRLYSKQELKRYPVGY